MARGGDGNDSVVADGADLDILDGFETVDRPAVLVAPPVNTATRSVTIKGGTVKVRKGTASITVSCPVASSGNCAGSLAVRTAGSVKLAAVKAVVQLGSARYNLTPGASKTLKVKLARGSRRLADRRGHLKALVVASTGASGSIAESSKRLTLALGTPAPRRSTSSAVAPKFGAVDSTQDVEAGHQALHRVWPHAAPSPLKAWLVQSESGLGTRIGKARLDGPARIRTWDRRIMSSLDRDHLKLHSA